METMEQLNQINRNVWQSLRRFGDINADMLRRVTEVQVNAVNIGIESSAEQVKLINANPGYNNLAAAQAEFNNRYGSKMVGMLREVVDIAQDGREEAMNWFESCLSDMQEGSETLARKATELVKAKR